MYDCHMLPIWQEQLFPRALKVYGVTHIQGKFDRVPIWPFTVTLRCAERSFLPRTVLTVPPKGKPSSGPRSCFQGSHGIVLPVVTNTDSLLCHSRLKSTSSLCLPALFFLLAAVRQPGGSRRPRKPSSVTLAHSQLRDTYASRDKARLFLLTHTYFVHCHTFRSYSVGEWVTGLF